MIPILHSEHLYKNTLKSLGLGPLPESNKCVVTEQRNGEFTCNLSYPAKGRMASELKPMRHIIASVSGGDRDYQAFQIVEVKKGTSGNIEVSAEHISYKLEDIPFFPPVLECNNVDALGAMQILKTNSVELLMFDFETQGFGAERNTFKFDIANNLSIRKALGGSEGSLLTHFNGEYFFDNFLVRLCKEREGNRGRKLLYGRELFDGEFEESVANTYTAVLPFAKKDDSYIVLPEKVMLSENTNKFVRKLYKVVDLSEKADSVESLRRACAQYIKRNNIGVPDLNLRLKYTDLKKIHRAQFPKLSFPSPRLCEVVKVGIPELDVDVEAKIVEIEWDSLRDEVISIELGTPKRGLSEALSTKGDEISSLKEDLQNKANKYLVSNNTGKRYEWRVIEQNGVVKPELVEVT